MTEFLHDLSHWLLDFADSDWAVAVLLFTAFIESMIAPIPPPDPLLIAVAIVQRPFAIVLGILVTIASVAGALAGHALGMWLGRPLLVRMFSEHRVASVDRLFERHGAWAVLMAAFTPVPYKLVAIAAGVWHLDRRKFIIASLIGRGARFGTIGVLVFLFGEQIEAFLTEHFEWLTIGITVVAVIVGAGWYFLHRRRHL